jgi:hypothetical protein
MSKPLVVINTVFMHSARTVIMGHRTGASNLRGREAAWLQISQARNEHQGGT